MVSLNEYLIHKAVKHAKDYGQNSEQPVTHQKVVNYLHGSKLWDALDEYFKVHIHTIEDLDKPLDEERVAANGTTYWITASGTDQSSPPNQ